MIALTVVALVGALTALVVLFALAAQENDDLVPAEDRPGNDDQWPDLVDAMRRYRRHKTRERGRA